MKTFSIDDIVKVPSVKCDKCGSTQVIVTDDGKECDECNKTIKCEEEFLSFGIDVSEDVDTSIS